MYTLDLARLMIVSQVDVVEGKETGVAKEEQEEVRVRVQRASGHKCPRCWNWTLHKEDGSLCARCEDVLG